MTTNVRHQWHMQDRILCDHCFDDMQLSRFANLVANWIKFISRIQICFLIKITQMIENSIAYLVYFNCRGTGHYYRYLLYEIGCAFQEIHVNLDGTMPECLKNYAITLADIPCIIVEGKVFKELYPSIRYLCSKFDRSDLLGNNLYEQTKISEVFSKSAKKRSNVISTFLKYMPKIKKEPSQLKTVKLEMLEQMINTPGSTEALAFMYSKTGSYLFDHITAADFLLYENCYYFCRLFKDVAHKKWPILFAYKNYFERTEFYKKHQQKIEGFKFIVPEFDENINQGFKIMCNQQ